MIYILTYNVAHRKTYDVLHLLKSHDKKDVTVIALPYHYTKKYKPLINHRPQVYADIQPEMLCKALDYKYEFIGSFSDITRVLDKKEGPILICGAGIIPAELIEKYTIINSHPGILPLVRGLDAFKWAVYEMQPIGVTTHIIDNETDAGFLIDQKIIEVTWGDSFHSLAQRQYEQEIVMLVEALEKVKNISHKKIVTDGFPVHKRMGKDLEKKLFSRFEAYKRKFATEQL